MSDRRKNVSLQQVGISALLDNMPEAVLIFNRQGTVIEANHAALCLAEVRDLREATAGELSRRLKVSQDGKRVDFPQAALHRVLRGEEIGNELHLFASDDRSKPVEALFSASPIQNKDGSITGGLVVVRDITELRELQRRLADTDRHLAIGQMAAGIAHDVNNVLATISQAASLLSLEPKSREQRDVYLEMVQNAVKRGTEIVQRVRDYIRGGKGERDAINLQQVLREALEEAC